MARPDEDRVSDPSAPRVSSLDGAKSTGDTSRRVAVSAWRQLVLGLHILIVRLRFILLLVVLGLLIGQWDAIKNYWEKWSRPEHGHELGTTPDIEYFCPMDPSVVRAAPTNCPICGMPLSKRKKSNALRVELPNGVLSRMQYAPFRIEQAGIQTYEVGFQPLAKEIVTAGYVRFDETRRSRIVTRAAGFMEKLYVNQTWVPVEKNMPLAEIYSPELFTATRELLIATERTATVSLAELARQKLRLYGISDEEIQQIERSRHVNETLLIRSPQNGYIVSKEVVAGMHVPTGQTLYEVADLSIVWIEADVFEKDIPFLYQDCEVQATVEAFPNEVFRGRITLIYQQVDAKTRTNRIRLEVANPDFKLRPGMFTTVRVEVPLVNIEPFRTIAEQARVQEEKHAAKPELRSDYFVCPVHSQSVSDQPGTCIWCGRALEHQALASDRQLIWWCPMHPEVTSEQAGATCDRCDGMKLVPRIRRIPGKGDVVAVPITAVVDTGEHKIVYVERTPGVFDGVAVELGPRTRHFYPVVKGIAAGDRVATAGSFLLDAETRLNPGAAAAYFGAISGGQRDSAAQAPPSDRANDSPFVPRKPLDLSGLSPADHELVMNQRLCPVTELPLGSMGTPYKISLDGQTVFLCCKSCEKGARKEPEKTLKKASEKRPN